MKPKNIGSVLALLIMLAPFLMSYNSASPEATVQDIAPPSTLTPSSGNSIVVTSIADSGPGTFRQALLELVGGENITFDLAIFPPSAPATIYLESRLPDISQGYVTVDASNAGVILDGSNISEGFVDGLHLTSNGNIIRGLQFLNFRPGAGISLSHGAQNNTIGGDRGIGTGPLGQGNLISWTSPTFASEFIVLLTLT